jgi:DivIVA domain-containing protein
MSHVRFRRVGWLHRGYHCNQVDTFFAWCEQALGASTLPVLSAADIRRAGFELVRHGYEPAAVDAALDELEDRALAAQGVVGGRRGRLDLGSEVAFLRQELGAPYMQRFRRAHALRRGYDVDEVDDFVDTVSEALAGGAAHLSVEDVRTRVFHPKWGGYDENAVDDALDRVVELLLLLRETSTTVAPPAVPNAAAPPA